MRYDDIRVGGIYWDGKQGVRQVISQTRPDDIVVYGTLAQGGMPAVLWPGDESISRSRMLQSSLASWAKARVPEPMLDALLTAIKAEKLRFTPAQKEFLDALGQFGREESMDLFSRHESRIAKKLEAMGIVEIMPGDEPSQPKAQPTRLGKAVLDFRAGRDFRDSLNIFAYTLEPAGAENAPVEPVPGM